MSVSACHRRLNHLLTDKAPTGDNVHPTRSPTGRPLPVLTSTVGICRRTRYVSQVPRHVLDFPLVEFVGLWGRHAVVWRVVLISGSGKNEIRAAFSQLFRRNVVETLQTERQPAEPAQTAGFSRRARFGGRRVERIVRGVVDGAVR